MCVIAIAQTVRPTEDMVEKMWRHNDDGFGIAYRGVLTKGKDKGKIGVCWQKGVEDLKDAIKLCAEAPLPYVAHFRIASQGGIVKELTHPFPIEQDVPMDLEGQTAGGVLFHNGDWSGWRHHILIPGRPLPKGDKMSDTRAMAFLVSIYGTPFMNVIEEKGVAFYGNRIETFTGKTGWIKVNDIWCSNNYFNLSYSHHTSPHIGAGNFTQYPHHGQRSAPRMCFFGHCTETLLNYEGYCEEHRKDKTIKFYPIYGLPERNDPSPAKSTVITLPGEIAKVERNGVQEAALPHTNTATPHHESTQPRGESQGSGGTSTMTPFQVICFARQQREEKKISKNALKRAEKVWASWQRKFVKSQIPKPLTVN